MKVVYLITGLATGGAEFALYNLLRSGLSEQHDVHVVSLNNEGAVGPKIKDLGIPVSTMNIPRGRPSILWMWRLLRLIQRVKPDIIVGWMYHGNVCAYISKRLINNDIPLVWNVRHSLYNLEDEKLITRQVIRINRLLSKRPDAIIYNSTLAKSQHEEFGFYSAHGDVYPNGVDTNKFIANKEMRVEGRVDLGIPPDALLVGHVARFHPLKDHKTFLRAAMIVATQHPSAHFVLAGLGVQHDNKKLQPEIPNELQDRFHFLGERSDVCNLMNCMDVYCQSSISEAFPNVLGEAMSTEVPCVATDVGDSSVIVGDTGILVPPRAHKLLAQGISKMLSMPTTERLQLGSLARKRIESKFTLDLMHKNYSSLYQQLVEKRSRS